MKIVVINSNGPMGSSVVGAIVEKFGYLNAPVRNLGLNRCLLSQNETDIGRFKQNFINMFTSQSKKIKMGGVSMLDRDSGPSYCPIDKSLIEKEISDIEKSEFTSISDLYTSLRSAYTKAIKYKTSKHVPGKHIEYTTYFDQYPTKELCDAYVDEFKDVTFIHMHRNFVGWVESVMSQYFSGSHRWHIILLHALRRRYVDYENSIKHCPGLHIDFDSLFKEDRNQVIAAIAEELCEPVPLLKWDNVSYDLYGQLRDFSSTFTLADVEGTHLSSGTRWFIRYCVEKEKITRFHDLIFYVFCLYDAAIFVIKKRLKAARL
ncbi:hypothetical protein UWK_02445 [Desulfocapsa sulfexigens DSM 10523]|uniref:Sulfotransferase family protein n=1 Tax=Desulfocapsa sulfexigens (strain DSM 10523 / SB164P1) TaxID=1167006 RepID=M1NHB1_DESSD|nr:hypothetical protein [Desulfocapsa sulfexigens]AGF78984.1 hypothetical protein UWK_02445 [Desulfocapsa sulfexigens DSM 10523]